MLRKAFANGAGGGNGSGRTSTAKTAPAKRTTTASGRNTGITRTTAKNRGVKTSK